MTPIKKTLAAIAVLAALGLGAAAIVQASGDDGERSVTGLQADKARSAALKTIQGGTANNVERDGENGATWEVEVTKPDGTTVDVRLDEKFGHLITEIDSEPPGDSK